MLETIIYKTNILGIIINKSSACNDVLSSDLQSVLKDVYTALMIAVPLLVIFLSVLDIFKAVVAQDEKDMGVARGRAVKRVIVGMAVFFIPIILDLLLDLVGIASGTCGIGG